MVNSRDDRFQQVFILIVLEIPAAHLDIKAEGKMAWQVNDIGF